MKKEKKKRIYISPAEIAEIIKRQVEGVTEDKELDPEGFIVFTNRVATRNIARSIADLFAEKEKEIFEYYEDGFDYWGFIDDCGLDRSDI